MARKKRRTVLVIEDDRLFQRSVKNFLKSAYDTVFANSGSEADAYLREHTPDLVLLDIMLPDVEGIEILKRIRAAYSDLPVIMLSAVDRIPKVVESIKSGAYDYLNKPIVAEDLLFTLDRALDSADTKRQLAQHQRLQMASNKNYSLIGKSKVLAHVRAEVETVSQTDATVLIQGETGTGKEVVARLIHSNSARSREPFVAVNCGAIPSDLIEAEFFGHKKGAFTGAQTDEIGKFQLANQGTLLLDEIGELSMAAQTRLLRVLEEQEFYPVGSNRLIKVDVRVLASTNKDLKAMVEERTFREDLYFRLNVFSIFLPPLRAIPEDVLEIGLYFLRYFNRKFNKNFSAFSPDAERVLRSYAWPGNIRELRNVMERVALSQQGSVVEVGHLAFLQPTPSSAESSDSFRLPPQGADLEDIERQLIQQALEMADGNKTQAARLLNLSPPTLYYRLEKFGLK